MARAVIGYGFEKLGLPRITGIASLQNAPSQHVLQKIGLRRAGERVFPHPAYAAEGPMAWFEGDREEWLRAVGPRGARQGTGAAPGLYV
jgi:RimJ/RimL family protein N-acetyltransferase